jgi:phenylalanyl-tRNA synthetase alpha chain
MAQIEELAAQARDEISGATTVQELEAARVKHLGRSAPIVTLLKSVGSLPPEERQAVGQGANRARKELEALADERGEALEKAELERRLVEDTFDVTLPGRATLPGGLHLITQTRRRMEDIFVGMGYAIADGPEVETSYYNFTALNTPEGHPARSPSDTFYLTDDTLLRTQTSPVQIRVMESQPPPVYIVGAGRTYRRDRIDATHGAMFSQLEGLAVDEGLGLADLKGTLEAFASSFFGGQREIRMRTHFFPFTEPSVEIDVSCYQCDATGKLPNGDRCRLCKGIGWIEILGAGMVDPNVFGYVDGYDPETITGFAFGIGIERMAMLRHGIPDLRMFTDNDLRFSTQF